MMLLLLLFCSLVNAQNLAGQSTTGQSTQVSSTTASATSGATGTTTATPSTLSSISTSAATSTLKSSSASTPPSTTATLIQTTVQQGPVDQPAATTGTPGGPTPYIYTTVVDGVTNVISALFTPTSPATTPVTPSQVGSILDYSSYIAVYGPTTTSSVSAGNALRPIPFSLILVVVLGILGGGGMLYITSDYHL